MSDFPVPVLHRVKTPDAVCIAQEIDEEEAIDAVNGSIHGVRANRIADGNRLEDGKLSYNLRHIGPEYIEYRPVLFLALPRQVLQRLRRTARRKRGGEARPRLPQQLIDLGRIRSMGALRLQPDRGQ
jgi:hypothetical protein